MVEDRRAELPKQLKYLNAKCTHILVNTNTCTQKYYNSYKNKHVILQL